MDALDPEPLLRFLYEQGIEHILIGGAAVAAHGYRRPSKDLDIVAAPNPENLGRLAQALLAIHARPAELGDFDLDEMPADATNVEDLALGATSGSTPISARSTSMDLWRGSRRPLPRGREALTFELDDIPVRYCSLRHLRAMKLAAGRPRDLDDLQHLPSE